MPLLSAIHYWGREYALIRGIRRPTKHHVQSASSRFKIVCIFCALCFFKSIRYVFIFTKLNAARQDTVGNDFTKMKKSILKVTDDDIEIAE